MANEVVKSRMGVFKSMMEAPSVQQQFNNALGENKNSFVASLIDLFGGDVSLQQCDPAKVVQEALKAAVLKLPITKSLGFAYVLVFNNSVKDEKGNWIKVATPTFVPGYKGYIQLAMRTGQYRTLNADVVYEGELKRKEKLTGFIDLSGEKTSDKVIGYFAHFELLNGFSKTLYVEVEDMAKHAKRYSPTLKAKKEVTVESLIILANQEVGAGSVGWLGNFEDMALKTCVRNLLSKYGYLSVEMMNVVSGDNEGEDGTVRRDEAIEDIRPKNLNIEDANFDEIPESETKQEETPKVDDGPGY